ncbi:MAG: hypothetical protein P8J27_05465 [Mariniblastus sp.]|nr:hypothetical protein [Mariniblastus sp.]
MMTIAVICIILGIIGLGFSCMTGFWLAAQTAFTDFIDGLPNQDITQKEFNRLNMAAQQASLVPTIIMLAMNLFIAPMLIAGGIGCLQRKSGGRRILNLALLAAIFFSLWKIGVQIFNYFAVADALNAAVANYEGDALQVDLEKLVQLNNIGMIVGSVIGVLLAVGLMCFYIWAKLYVSKEKTVQFFET